MPTLRAASEPPLPRPSRRTRVGAYNYCSSDGAVAFRKVRYAVECADGGLGKSFGYEYRARDLDELCRGRPTGTGFWLHGKPPGADQLIYGLPEVRRALAAGQDVWWTEGEKDADALAALGVTATSHHGGAGHVSASQAAWLSDPSSHSRVLLVADRDLRGMNDVVRRYDLLRATGVLAKRIRILRAAAGKDAADHLAAGLGLGDFVPVPLVLARKQAARADLRGLGSGYRPLSQRRS